MASEGYGGKRRSGLGCSANEEEEEEEEEEDRQSNTGLMIRNKEIYSLDYEVD